MSQSGSPPPLSWPRRIGWASGDAGINFYWSGIGTFAYFFYTDVMGISPLWAGIAFAIASLWDAITDPIMGAIADRTRTRFGRFRPWILFGSIPCAAAFALMFWTPPLAGGWLVAFAIGSHVLFRTLMTAVSIPFSALTARMTHDSAERGKIAMLRLMFAATGGLGVAFTVPRLVQVIGDEQRAYFYAAAILGLGATVILLISFLCTTEPDHDDSPRPTSQYGNVIQSFLGDMASFWSTLRSNGPLARLFAAIVLSGVATTLNSKVLLYWIKYDLGDQAVMNWLLPLPALVLMVMAPFWTWVAHRRSKREAWIAGMLLNAVSLTLFYLINPHQPLLIAAIVMLGAMGGSAGMVMFWSMLPDTVEYNQWVRGERSEARIFGFATFGQKAALAINALLLGQLLTHAGFVADQAQSAAVLSNLRAIMCIIPLAGVLGIVAIMWRYPITAAFHAKLRASIADREQKALAVVDD